MESKKNANSINSLADSNIAKWVTLTIAVIIFGLFAYGRFIRPVAVELYTNELGPVEAFGYILSENTAIQEFIFNQDTTVHNIELLLANYMSVRHNINQVYIYLNDTLVHEELIDSSVVVDNAFFPLSAMNVHVSEGDIMRIAITSRDGIPSEAITIWIRSDIASDNRLLRYNMVDETYENLPGEITMRIFSAERISPLRTLSEQYFNISTVWIYVLFGAIIVLTILSFFLMVKNDDGTPSSSQDSQEGA